MREWLKRIREQAGLSQKEIAERTGLSQNYYCYIETGERGAMLPGPTAQKIADALGFPWQRFYEEEQGREGA